jgi:hypothetical protein
VDALPRLAGRRVAARRDEAVGVLGVLGLGEAQPPVLGDRVGDVATAAGERARHCGLPWRAITTWVCSWPTSTTAVATPSVARSSRASAATGTRPRASAAGGRGQRDQLLGAGQAHRVGEHAHALGRRRHPAARRRAIGGRAGDGRQRLEGVDQVLEIDRDHALELGADRLVEIGAAQRLEPELEHVDEHLGAADGEVAGVLVELVLADDPASTRPARCSYGSSPAGTTRSITSPTVAWRKPGAGDRDLDAPGAQIDGEDAAHGGSSVGRFTSIPHAGTARRRCCARPEACGDPALLHPKFLVPGAADRAAQRVQRAAAGDLAVDLDLVDPDRAGGRSRFRLGAARARRRPGRAAAGSARHVGAGAAGPRPRRSAASAGRRPGRRSRPANS